jgi:hypothetical protein
MTAGVKAAARHPAQRHRQPDQGIRTSRTSSERQDKRGYGNRKITFA